MANLELDDQNLIIFINELINQHNCHSIILYGSRVRGDFDQDSDYDLAGFSHNEQSNRLAYYKNNVYLDAFIYSDREINDEKLLDLLKLRQGMILCEENNFLSQLLERLNRFFDRGPAILTTNEKRSIKVWAQKTIKRIQKGDIEANYRRNHLLTMLLEDYFALRDLWFLGSKESLAWLKENDRLTYEFFAQSLAQDASIETIKRLVERVIE